MNTQYKDVCCEGHNWFILDITESSVWGHCDNPECSERCSCKDENCYWDGISYIDKDEFSERYPDIELK